MNNFNLQGLIIRILILVAFLFSVKQFFSLKTSKKNSKSINNFDNSKKDETKKLRAVNKINTYIEEQDFLFSKVEKNTDNKITLLNKIEKNIENLEKEAKIEHVENLIDKNKIEEIKLNIQSLKQVNT